VPKLHNIIVYNSAINNIITLKLIKFQVTSVLSVSSVQFQYLPRYFGSSKLGTEHGTKYFDSVNFGSVFGSRYFVPTPIHTYICGTFMRLNARFSCPFCKALSHGVLKFM
jgi:hypothetical protein